ncbi:MAG: hypothetical protein EBR82_65185 [Caulobacteraceae bacterium]|nr:hypothetical protein [Caulobacteraceae bacterium]NDC23212.1 hypothetical protein [Pseudomonadota bacterium]NDD05362.1 hypothetical protein [Pseudomonadota bacterium]
MVTNWDDLEPKNFKIEQERVNAEYRLQIAVINHLTGRVKTGKDWVRGTPAFAGLFVTHIYQGRSKEDGFFLKQLGVVAGVADLLLIWRGGFGFVELKRQEGVQSTVQKKFQGFCHSVGVKYAVCRSVREVHDTLTGWGLTPTHGAIKEPDLRKDSEKRRAAFDEFDKRI